ncbi:hypothetical protein [Picosynechococcus sp. PCC 73109]|uniref:hypothetical protein n=1 Tax=Picosynechococcus sp. PCC 73109 TaxID=374982 RepID=UPI00074585CF|nr:hypothetical protein [Picosynechococcus sp. PCC 73109]AMA10632.1 hypothetical protein AWQ23_14385 [Picosynechococcus sp. PCC 73109]
MAKLDRSGMDQSQQSKEIRAFMGRHNLNLWQMARAMKIPSYCLSSVILGEGGLTADQQLSFDRLKLEMMFSR